MIIVKTICIISAIFVITVFSSGLLERCKKRSENETFVKALWNTIKTGFLKVLSSVGIALVTTAISVLILSTFIKPGTPKYHACCFITTGHTSNIIMKK